MRDAIELEWAGVPSIALIHNAMSGSAKAMKRLSGVPDYEFVTVDYPHIPTGVWTADEVKEIAREVTPKIVAALTQNGQAAPGGNLPDGG